MKDLAIARSPSGRARGPRRDARAEPGQLGKIARRMADAGVNIEVQYSDHDHQLILVVDDLARAREVAAAWATG